MIINNVKGTFDFLPKEERIRNYINGILRETFEEYGYLPIETPILCYYDMLSGKYDENNDILKEIYKLKDQGNRDLGLRYDLTVPFAKFIALNKNQLSYPFKRYEISKVFRDGPVKVGRDREFTQCDVDVVGVSGQLVEVELLSLYVQAFNRLGIDIVIKYNSRNLMVGLIRECGASLEIVNAVITVIDKMHKLKNEEFVEALNKVGIDDKQISDLRKYFELSIEELVDLFKDSDNEILRNGLDELSGLRSYIKELGLDKYCVFDSTLARGQDYYTGNVFEVYEKNGKLSGSIGGGGRYDRMISEFISDGELYPAVGISFGLTSIFELLKNKELDTALYDLYIVPMGTEIVSLKLANDLRKCGIKVIVDMNQRKVKKALAWASKNNIPYVMVIGDDEVSSGKVKLKDMVKSEEINCDINCIDDIVEVICK